MQCPRFLAYVKDTVLYKFSKDTSMEKGVCPIREDVK